MFDPTDPTSLSVAVLCVAFVCLVGILYIIRPTWVRSHNSKKDISWPLILSYSLVFALVVAICMLIAKATQGLGNVVTYETKIPTQSAEMASAFQV